MTHLKKKEDSVLDIVPRGTELGTQVKTGIRV